MNARSVAGRTLQSSYWPLLLRVESTASYGVSRSVEVFAYLIPLALILVAISSIVTPLGLLDTIISGDEIVAPFEYVSDTSPFGYGTPIRTDLGFSRRCGGFVPYQCPGSNTVVNRTDTEGTQSADVPFGYNVTIPQNLINLYSSGSRGSTSLSSLFDIQWRQYSIRQNDDINNGSLFLHGSFRQLQSLVLSDALEPVEGLIVDMKNGGIGLRNHTLPKDMRHGATWTEDLLFIEPETQCVDTNVTINFKIPQIAPDYMDPVVEDLVLTDAGGFVDINKTYPLYNRDDIQADPDLRGRAYKAAWMWNANTMAFYNVTNPNPNVFSYLNSSIGRTFPLVVMKEDMFTPGLNIISDWGWAVDSYDYKSNVTKPENPYQISWSNYTYITTICEGAGGKDIGNITNIAVSCGLISGAARREDGSASLTFDAGSKWVSSLFACATAVKAKVKSVDFRVDGNHDFKAFSVLDIQEKIYRGEDAKPLWGVENGGMPLSEGNPLWGLIAPSFEDVSGISSVRKESLYLPGHASLGSTTSPFGTAENLAGADFPSKALSLTYAVANADISPFSNVIDYSGRSSMALYAKWQKLSQTPDTAAKILNLIWTDLSASAVTGSKGATSLSTDESIQKPVRPLVRKIGYNYPYAVPAFIVALLSLIVIVLTFVSWAFGASNIKALRRHLYHTCAGRLMTTLICPEESDLRVKSRTWLHVSGQKLIDLSGSHPVIDSDEVIDVAKGRHPD